MRRNVDRAPRLAARRIKCVQFVAGREPDLTTVARDTGDLVDARKRPILLNDVGCCFLHLSNLTVR